MTLNSMLSVATERKCVVYVFGGIATFFKAKFQPCGRGASNKISQRRPVQGGEKVVLRDSIFGPK